MPAVILVGRETKRRENNSKQENLICCFYFKLKSAIFVKKNVDTEESEN